jgi:hypothetical protein
MELYILRLMDLPHGESALTPNKAACYNLAINKNPATSQQPGIRRTVFGLRCT